MKMLYYFPKPTAMVRQRGFALVVTLSLMILLTVIAVGLLSLSSISLRSAGQGSALSEARANARLALMMAIGDLQKNAGLDTRVTARSDINDKNVLNPRLTGVWKSWAIKATEPPVSGDYDQGAKSGPTKFLGWLTSSPDGKSATEFKFADSAIPSDAKKIVTLWGEFTLGKNPLPADIVRAYKVPTAKNRGAFAWAVIDEGVKARINTSYSDIASTNHEKAAKLAAGKRPGIEFITGLSKLKREYFEESSPNAEIIAKGISASNYLLAVEQLPDADKATKEVLKALTHDLSVASVGLFTNTANGGLKEDLNLMTDSGTLPAKYANKGIYESVLLMKKSDAPSDPQWQSFLEISTLYKNKVTTINGSPQIKTQAPVGWAASNLIQSGTVLNPAPPNGVVLVPSIAKVQMFMSLIGRDLYGNLPAAPLKRPLTAKEKSNGIHGPQDGNFRKTKYDYDLHLLYTPVVTLHNPYNVAIECKQLKVEFSSVPFGLRINRSGQYQTKDRIAMEHMTQDNEAGQKAKTFGLTLHTKKNGRPDSNTFTMMPGEVTMFSPYINPDLNWLNRNEFWDITLRDDKTKNLKAMPGWPGDGIGFDCDWLGGNQLVNQTHADGHWGGCIAIAHDDQIFVEFGPTAPRQSKNKFLVKMTAADAAGRAQVVNTIELDYENPTGLDDFIGAKGEKMPMRYPKADAVPNYILGSEIVDRANTKISSIKRLKTFAILTLQAKTTLGGKDTLGHEGRFASKPWCFGHSNVGASPQKITRNPASASHEIDLIRLDSGLPLDWVESDQLFGRGNAISGLTAQTGTKLGVQYEIPLGPLQTLSKLNSANPGGSSGYLPRFAQPIGNSWAHPMLSPGNITSSSQSGPLLDHSYLLNLALADGFYFSGFAKQPDSTNTAETLVTAFAKGGKSLNDARVKLYAPNGMASTELVAEAKKAEGYANVAGWQVMEGAFNINSTSVSAWKAMLSSIHAKDAVFNSLSSVARTSTISPLTAVAAGQSRISRLSLPVSDTFDSGATAKNAYWLGPRDYTEAQLQTLAEKIVEQVRARGPFLSMSEFVNRQIGSGPLAQKGALQQAIDEANLNDGTASAASAGYKISQAAVGSYQYENPEAGAGDSYQGAPGYLTQADLLNMLGNAAAARSDTFTIRGYGESRNTAGEKVASAYCEAIVQRVPDWIDPADAVALAPASLTSKANRDFGRRFVINSFRWLKSSEI